MDLPRGQTGGHSVMMAIFGRFLPLFASWFGVSLAAHAAARGHSPVTLLSTIVSALPTVLGAIDKYRTKDPTPPPRAPRRNAVWDDPSDPRFVIVQTEEFRGSDIYGNPVWVPISPPERKWR